MSLAIEIEGLHKIYDTGAVQVHALKGIDLSVAPGEMVAVVGPSGSGKTTLMEIVGCLSKPTEGSYRLGGRDVDAIDSDGLARLRGESIGFVFQSFNLLPRLSALENVELPLGYRGVSRRRRRERAAHSLERVGLGQRLGHKPTQMSGGERQRVAVARALVGDPSIVLADEPTGNLDSRTGEGILALLRDVNDGGATVLIVTHDAAVAANASRRLTLHDGSITHDAQHANERHENGSGSS